MRAGKFRQLAMIHAMQGLLANPRFSDFDMMSIVKLAVQHADALLDANTIDEEPNLSAPKAVATEGE
jgi:hypothetical protein